MRERETAREWGRASEERGQERRERGHMERERTERRWSKARSIVEREREIGSILCSKKPCNWIHCLPVSVCCSVVCVFLSLALLSLSLSAWSFARRVNCRCCRSACLSLSLYPVPLSVYACQATGCRVASCIAVPSPLFTVCITDRHWVCRLVKRQ